MSDFTICPTAFGRGGKKCTKNTLCIVSTTPFSAFVSRHLYHILVTFIFLVTHFNPDFTPHSSNLFSLSHKVLLSLQHPQDIWTLIISKLLLIRIHIFTLSLLCIMLSVLSICTTMLIPIFLSIMMTMITMILAMILAMIPAMILAMILTMILTMILSMMLTRWTSRENLLAAAGDEDGDPQLFVSLYDFQVVITKTILMTMTS